MTGEPWTTRTGSTTYKAAVVELPDDLLDDAPDDVSWQLGAEVQVELSHAAPGRGAANSQRGNGHAAVTFHFSDDDQDACDSEVVVGPFEITVSDGSVTLSAESMALDAEARGLIRHGRVYVCAEVQSDFDGSLTFDDIAIAFGNHHEQGDSVEVCHAPPGNPDQRHTILVGAAAVEKHLRHGDELGPCFGVSDSDNDGDGVRDSVDQCLDTPQGEEVDETGCSVVVLAVDAGADLTVIAGDPATLAGSAAVVQGDAIAAELIYLWEQMDGPVAAFSGDSATLNIETDGIEGDLHFGLTVSTPDGTVSVTDGVVVTVIPPQIVDIVSAKWHNVALWNNGEISGWGWNRYGQLGDGSIDDDVVSVDAGLKHTVVAKVDGTVWTFGQNAISSSSVPVQVSGVDDAVQVAALTTGALALSGDGTVRGFSDGFGEYCDLAGAPSLDENESTVAVPVPGLPENVVQIEAGARHALALDGDGTAWVWGSRFGCTPWAVMEGVAEVAAGNADLCLFRLTDGTVWSIGFNLHGQLGNGTMRSSYDTPTEVIGLSRIVGVAAGARHSAFLGDDGTLYMAGWNRYCQLGLEDEVEPSQPQFGAYVVVPTAISLGGFALVSGGFSHGVAVRQDNTVWAWGLNSVGQLSGGTLSVFPYSVCMPLQLELTQDD